MLKLFSLFLVFVIILCFGFWKLWFSRKPERSIPEGPTIVSPANGKVVKILDYDGSEEIKIDKGYLGKIKTWTEDVAPKVKIIVIMMTPLDVHVQRAPFEGKVLAKKYVEGNFLDAVKGAKDLKATLENEHNEILFETSTGWRYKVIQVAGFLARRIYDYVEVGDIVKKGQEIGFIDLGSQVVLIVPQNMELKIAEGAIVLDGETIIANAK